MATVRYVGDAASPARVTPEDQARLDALTDEEITAAAESDLDNPPLTDAEFQRIHAIQVARRARTRAQLSQDRFARAYGIKVSRLRDLEQGRVQPDPVLVAYLALIADDPERAHRIVKALAAA